MSVKERRQRRSLVVRALLASCGLGIRFGRQVRHGTFLLPKNEDDEADAKVKLNDRKAKMQNVQL